MATAPAPDLLAAAAAVRWPPMRQLYLAATGMNRGKTTFALGLYAPSRIAA